MTKVRGTVVIDVEACKGCELCIPACPPEVLVMTATEVNERGYRYPKLVSGCTGCRACLDVCPDFCFEVYKFAEPHDAGTAEAPDAPDRRDDLGAPEVGP